ncbi:MAG: nucleotidyltransferase [Tissierellaceae bacterium]|nr:nucleotidyltransferase [Tissierellaceae bacterium]
MKVVSFITEYNPFHFGHKFHLDKSLALTGATHSISIMSSSFVQRGEPSLVDKWTKAKMAIENGVDLVIELPFIYSIQSAEFFALGGIKIMEALNIVDYIAFGSEIGDLEPLVNIANILVDESEEFKAILQDYLNLGMSFPAARSLAIKDYINLNSSLDFKYDYESILKQSNNILAIEYLKALKSLNSSISPIVISRQGPDYKDDKISENYASATAIRRSIYENGINSVINLVPEPTYKLLESFYNKYNKFNNLENYYSVIKYLLLTIDKDKLNEILDIENGLENRIIEKSLSSMNVKDIVERSSTKRYPKTRIQRILIHLLTGLSGQNVKNLYAEDVPYIRFLAANKKGLQLLNLIKEKSRVPILTKFSHHENFEDSVVKEFAKFENKATDIYYFGLNTDFKFNNMDYKTSPFIKK